MTHLLTATIRSFTVFAIASAPLGVALALDYEKDIIPLLKARCFECHSNEEGKTKGNLVLDDIAEMRDYQVGRYSLIRPHNAAESQFVELMKLPAGDSDAMPPKGERIPEESIRLIEQWIMEGATIGGLTRNAEGEPVEAGAGGSEAGGEEAGMAEQPAAEYLTWINAEGVEIEARFVRLEGEKVVLLMRDGVSYPYPLAKLSAESQAQAQQLAGAAEPATSAQEGGESQ